MRDDLLLQTSPSKGIPIRLKSLGAAEKFREAVFLDPLRISLGVFWTFLHFQYSFLKCKLYPIEELNGMLITNFSSAVAREWYPT